MPDSERKSPLGKRVPASAWLGPAYATHTKAGSARMKRVFKQQSWIARARLVSVVAWHGVRLCIAYSRIERIGVSKHQPSRAVILFGVLLLASGCHCGDVEVESATLWLATNEPPALWHVNTAWPLDARYMQVAVGRSESTAAEFLYVTAPPAETAGANDVLDVDERLVMFAVADRPFLDGVIATGAAKVFHHNGSCEVWVSPLMGHLGAGGVVLMRAIPDSTYVLVACASRNMLEKNMSELVGLLCSFVQCQ